MKASSRIYVSGTPSFAVCECVLEGLFLMLRIQVIMTFVVELPMCFLVWFCGSVLMKTQ